MAPDATSAAAWQAACRFKTGNARNYGEGGQRVDGGGTGAILPSRPDSACRLISLVM